MIIMENKTYSHEGSPSQFENKSQSEVISMYDISGQDGISEHSYERYLRNKDQNQGILERAKNSASAYEIKIISAAAADRDSVILEGLESRDVEVQMVCARAAHLFSEDWVAKKVIDVIKTGLKNNNVVEKETYAIMITYAPDDAQDELREMVADLIKAGLDNEDVTAQLACAGLVSSAPDDIIAVLIRDGLEKNDVRVQKAFADMIWSVPDSDKRDSLMEKVFQLIQPGLGNEDVAVQRVYAEMISYVLWPDHIDLIRAGLEMDDVAVQR